MVVSFFLPIFLFIHRNKSPDFLRPHTPNLNGPNEFEVSDDDSSFTLVSGWELDFRFLFIDLGHVRPGQAFSWALFALIYMLVVAYAMLCIMLCSRVVIFVATIPLPSGSEAFRFLYRVPANENLRPAQYS